MNKARRSEKSRGRNIVGAPLKGNIAQTQDQQLNKLLLLHLCSDTAVFRHSRRTTKRLVLC